MVIGLGRQRSDSAIHVLHVVTVHSADIKEHMSQSSTAGTSNNIGAAIIRGQ